MITNSFIFLSTDSTSILSSNIVSSSLFVADGLDACVPPPPLPPHLSGVGGWTSYPPQTHNSVYTSPPPHLQLSTPESSPQTVFPHVYPPQQPLTCGIPPRFQVPPNTTLPPVRDLFFCGSSLEESPISSPGDLERENTTSTAASTTNYVGMGVEQQKLGFNRSCSPLAGLGISRNFDSASNSGDDESLICHPTSHHPTKQVPDGVKMPQRKGGMQLWQFLYSMLNDKDGKYRNLIEWTHTAKERQFRLLEPDAIAVWWGHHKNKPNMSYDKLSRSLRYYYDKGIIRKISGERFVYRFCIDPEVMYRHMGTSNARPQLKPMPQDAKVALNSKDCSVSGASPCIAKEPEMLTTTSGNTVEQIPTNYSPLFPPSTFANSLPVPSNSSFIIPSVGGSGMRRCHSYESTCRSAVLSPSQTPSPGSCYDGYPSFYSNSFPAHFTSSCSPGSCSPPHSAPLDEYPYVPFTDFPHRDFPNSFPMFSLPPPPLLVDHPIPPFAASDF
jgi:hypothetical protein